MKFLVTLISFFLVAATAHAEELTAEQIVNRSNLASYYAGKDGRADVKMTITARGGETRVREFTILRWNEAPGGNQKFYVYFKEPADVRKMAYLVWKQMEEGKEDDRWLWLPALNLVRRIAPGDKRTSFVGSDFLYEDVSGRNVKADKHELIETAGDHYLLKGTPLMPDEVEFSHYNVWVDKKTFLPTRAEYYDKNARKYRVIEASRVETIQGLPTVLQAVARDLNSGSQTVNEFSNIKYNLDLNEDIFTERFLRRPPREVR